MVLDMLTKIWTFSLISLETMGLVMGLAGATAGLELVLRGALAAVAGALLVTAALIGKGLVGVTGFLAITIFAADLTIAVGFAEGLAGTAFAAGLGKALTALLGLVAVFLEFLFSGMRVRKFSLRGGVRVESYYFYEVRFF